MFIGGVATLELPSEYSLDQEFVDKCTRLNITILGVRSYISKTENGQFVESTAIVRTKSSIGEMHDGEVKILPSQQQGPGVDAN